MAISISVVLLLLILVVVFMRNGALKFSHALTCALLGFLLASTTLAPTIHNGLTVTGDLLGSLRP